MGFSVWVCVLCLQASLLSQALDCSGASRGELRVSGQTTNRQQDDPSEQRAIPFTDGLVLFRRKRQLDRRGPTHLSHLSLPGAVSVKGFPKILIQADRSRRHLKKKIKQKTRPGTYSLICHDKTSSPPQVVRVRRQMKLDPPKTGKTGRTGAFSVLGDPQTDGQSDRPERSM